MTVTETSLINRYPYGYKEDADGQAGMATMLSQQELERMLTVSNLHPEFWRRFMAMIEDACREGVPLGVGTGWRIQPNPPPPGFASPGNSNHEGFPADGVSGGAVAIDTVPQKSWDWMEAHCAPYGSRTFRNVNNEPWHVQPSDIPAGRSGRTEPWDLPRWNLPGRLDPEEDEVTDEEINRIINGVTEKVLAKLPPAVWQYPIDTTPNDDTGTQPAQYWLHRSQLIVRQRLGGTLNETPETPMLVAIDTNVKKLLK